MGPVCLVCYLLLQGECITVVLMLMVDLLPTNFGGIKSPTSNTRQRGFTIVELMVATIVFSVIMLVAAGAVVRFTTNFQRSVTATNTQNTARSIIDSVSQTVQFAGGDVPTPLTAGGKKGWCVGYTRYSYVLGKQLTGEVSGTTTRYALVGDSTGTGCFGEAQDVSSAATPGGQELLGTNMRLSKFNITEKDPLTGLWEISVRVVYGDDDLLCTTAAGNCNNATVLTPSQLESPDLQCKGEKGNQYCAISELTTTVQRRL